MEQTEAEVGGLMRGFTTGFHDLFGRLKQTTALTQT